MLNLIAVDHVANGNNCVGLAFATGWLNRWCEVEGRGVRDHRIFYDVTDRLRANDCLRLTTV